MNQWVINFHDGAVYLVHSNCGAAFIISEGDTLTQLMDTPLAHNCILRR